MTTTKPTLLHAVKPAAEPATAAAQANPSEGGTLATARVFKALMAHFDDNTGRFSTGWSDKRIAEDTGIALAAVITLRNQCFGELSEDPALTGIRSDVTALEDLIRDAVESFTASITEIRARLSKVGQ